MHARTLLRLAAMTSTAFLAGGALAAQPKAQPDKFKQLETFKQLDLFKGSPEKLKKAA